MKCALARTVLPGDFYVQGLYQTAEYILRLSPMSVYLNQLWHKALSI